MFKIGEFSQLGQVTVRTLRHYDDLSLLKPAFTDPESDYRYYAIEQLPRLNRIVALKDLGLTLDQIARLLEDGSDISAEHLRGMLLLREAEIAQRIHSEEAQLQRVAARLRQIEHEGRVTPYEVVRKAVGAQVVATIRATVPRLEDMTAYRCSMYTELYDWLRQHDIVPSGHELAFYHATEYIDHDIDMELGVVVPHTALGMSSGRVVISSMPAAAEVASVMHHGDIWDIPQVMIALVIWFNANGLTVQGAFREIHHFGRENDLHDISNLVIEMQLPYA